MLATWELFFCKGDVDIRIRLKSGDNFLSEYYNDFNSTVLYGVFFVDSGLLRMQNRNRNSPFWVVRKDGSAALLFGDVAVDAVDGVRRCPGIPHLSLGDGIPFGHGSFIDNACQF